MKQAKRLLQLEIRVLKKPSFIQLVPQEHGECPHNPFRWRGRARQPFWAPMMPNVARAC